MSHDEIVFDDVRYREPERRVRPDRDRKWACVAYEVPGPHDLPIYLERATADAIERHALRDTSVELGGILLGKECIDDQTGLPFVFVTKSLEAKHYENTQASFTYTHDSWEEITRERDRLHPDLDIVGWYHTHPDFGIFLSSHDLFIHHHFFAQPLQVAYVVDPIRQTRGFFRWRDNGLEQVGGYYLMADRRDRVALARLVNDLENFPNTEGGGGLSPRLEAELITMLTRPSPSTHSSNVMHSQTAALMGLGGAIAGMALLYAMLWLNSLHTQIQEQATALKELVESQQKVVAKQNLAFETLLDQSRGVSSEKLLAKFDQATREREEYRRELDRYRTINAALNDRAQGFEARTIALKKDLALAKQDADAYQLEKKDAPDLHTRIANLVEDSDKKAKEITQLRLIADTTEGRKAEQLVSKYNTTWYAAVAGWGVGIAMVLALLTLLAQTNLFTEPEPAQVKPDPTPQEPGPTHRII